MRSIDIHAHLTPQCFFRAVDSGKDWHGIKLERDTRGREFLVAGEHRAALHPRNRWTVEQRLADMDSLGVDVHVLSTNANLYGYHLPAEVCIATSRDANDEVAEMVKSHPDRLAGLATLPMQDLGAAIAELERAVDKLGLKGAMINDHVNGRTYDEPEFLPFFKAAERLGALIFFHQGNGTIVRQRIPRYHLHNTIGNLVERAITFASLVFGGVMDQCPDLKVCLAHGGGYTCYGIGRMDRGFEMRPEARIHIQQPPSKYLRHFYYDCLTWSEAALRFLVDTVGADRVVFGTDWPADMAIDWPVSWVLGLASLTQEEKELILWKNLERLLGL
ncbi:MAG: amidohydrolase family protein [Dehalococcoidia bacterium]